MSKIKVNKLPHLRKTVTIEFSSLRNGLGENWGVIFDIDTIVKRDAYRVKTKDCWKWQIKAFNQLYRHDNYVEIDQEILDEIGSDMGDVKILPVSKQ